MTNNDDLRATIARLRGSVERNAVYGYRDLVIEDDDLTAILDAAERAQKMEEALRKIQALDDSAECCGQGVFSGSSYPECCNQPLYGLDRAKEISIRALKEPTDG